MTKIDKIDINNINLIIKESGLKGVSKIKIKKNNYEIEITSDQLSTNNQNAQIIERSPDKLESSEQSEVINEENIIKSPMVGVAYLSADPNSSPYVKIGQHVKAGETLLLIEAMKTFNEIKSDRDCTINSIMVKNGEAVEFGQPLFEIS